MNQQLLQTISGKTIVGIDEVGRGSWAGPLVVGAVILDPDRPIEGLTDSKVLTAKAREGLSPSIQSRALFCSTGWVWPDEVDELGLTAATTLAIERSLQNIIPYDHIVIDGIVNFLPSNAQVLTLPKADMIVPSVSAASIIAKVARDQYMADQALLYPNYGFESHVGYGTLQHRLAITEHGLTPLHRTSYKPVRRYIEEFAAQEKGSV